MSNNELETLINESHEVIGATLLKKWNFPQAIVDAVAEHDDIHRDFSEAALPDYADVSLFTIPALEKI